MAIPDWKLERILLGEESDEGLDADDRARLEALRASNRELLERYPPKLVAERIERELRKTTTPERRPAAWVRPAFVAAPALAGLAVLFLVAAPGGDAVSRLDGHEVTRLKGEVQPALSIHRRGAQGPERLLGGAPAAAGDLLQLSYLSAGAAHGVILSVDGGGAVTLHHPARAGLSTALVGGEPTPLPEAYELDAAPGFERFFLVTGPSPIDVVSVLDAARRLAAEPDRARTEMLPLPAGLSQTSVLLVKP